MACRTLNLPDRIEQAVREWPNWSPAERRRMDEVVEEVLDHCRSGTGNRFVAEWCNRVLGEGLEKV